MPDNPFDRPPELKPRLEKVRDQHDLFVAALRLAGGIDAAAAVPTGAEGKIADVVLMAEHLIVEVKSLTVDRRLVPTVKERLGAIMDEGAKYGGPIVFGTVRVRLDQLPPKLGERMLREIGDRVRKEVSHANRQIAATAEKLGWSSYAGIVAFVTPREIMDRDTIGWLVHDTVKGGRHPSVNYLIVANSTYLSGTPGSPDSHLTFHSRDGFDVGMKLKRKIGAYWAALHGQVMREVSQAELDRITRR